jgi:hypothetical protein
MKNLIITVASLLIVALGTAHAATYSTDENYIRLDLTPLCTVDGQVTLTLSNTSGQQLFVDPHIADPALFDAASAMMYLYKMDDNSLVGLQPLKEYVRTSDWSVLAVGAGVSYPIDFTKYASLDTTKSYKAGAELHIDILLEDGHKVSLILDSAVLNKYAEIQPECFK